MFFLQASSEVSFLIYMVLEMLLILVTGQSFMCSQNMRKMDTFI